MMNHTTAHLRVEALDQLKRRLYVGSCVNSIWILTLLVTSFLMVGPRSVDAATARATVNSISATGIGGALGTVIFTDSAQGLMITHLTVEQIRGRSIMIHAGGDNYSDSPKPLGGGGARIACGVIH